MKNIQQIRDIFAEKYSNNEFFYPKDQKTVEIINASFIVDDSYIFSLPNPEYLKQESDWYSTQSLNINDIPGNIPKIWKQVASPEGLINSNYGYLVYNEGNFAQFDSVLQTLTQDKNSRRAIMIYTRPSIQQEYDKDGMSDFICTNTVQYFIRDDKLITSVSMRSNDAIFGFRNDCFWQDCVSFHLLFELQKVYPSVTMGTMYWNVGSLHIYEPQFYLIDHYIKSGELSISKQEYKELYNEA